MKNKTELITLAALFLSLLFLTGCWDKIELENRGFVVSIGLDKAGEKEDGNRYAVTMALPDVAALTSKGGEKESRWVGTEHGRTVAGAMSAIDASSSQKLYVGLTRMTVFGRELLSDAMLFREAMDSLERNSDINRKMIMLATKDDAKSILEANATGKPMVGMYVASYYQNRAFAGDSFPQDLEKVVQELRGTGGCVLPLIEEKDGKVRLSGAAVVKDFALVGFLDDKETRGYVWVKGNCQNAVVSVGEGKASLPLAVERSRSKLSFFEGADGLHCEALVDVRGRLEGYSDEEWQTLAGEYEAVIEEEIRRAADRLQKDWKADGYQLKEALRKKKRLIV